jgi:hypothetical protein
MITWWSGFAYCCELQMLSLAIGPSPRVLLKLQVGGIVLPIDSFVPIVCQFEGGMLWIGFAEYQAWLLGLTQSVM